MKSVLVRQAPEYPASVSDVARALLKFDDLIADLGLDGYDEFRDMVEQARTRHIGLRHTLFNSDHIVMRIEDAAGDAFYLHYMVKARTFQFYEPDDLQDKPDLLKYSEVPYVGQLSLDVINIAVSAEISYVRALLQE